MEKVGCLQVGYFHCCFVVRWKQDIFGYRGCQLRRRKAQYRRKTSHHFFAVSKMSTCSRHNLCRCVQGLETGIPVSRIPGNLWLFSFPGFPNKIPGIPGWYHYVTNLKILYEIFNFVLRKQKFV